MAIQPSMEVVGIKEALKELNRINPQFRRQITKDFKQIADPVVKQAQASDIGNLALSGFSRNWTTRSGYKMFPLDGKKMSRFIVAGTSGKKPKEFRGNMQNATAFFVRWKSPQATLLEMSARGELGAAMVAKSGPPGRVLWRAWEAKEKEVMGNVEKLVKGIMAEANKTLRKR